MTGQEMISMIGIRAEGAEEDDENGLYTAEDVDRALMAQAQIQGTALIGEQMATEIF